MPDRSTRIMGGRVRVLVLLAAVAVSAAALWWFAPKLVGLSAALITNEHIVIDKLEIESTGIRQSRIRTVAGELHTAYGTLRFAADDVTVDYDLANLTLDRVTAQQADIHVDMQPAPTTEPADTDALAFIPTAIDISTLGIRVNSPMGEHQYDGALKVAAIPDGVSLNADGSNAKFHLQVDPKLSNLRIKAGTVDGKEIAVVEIDLDQTGGRDIRARFSVATFLHWLRRTSLVPAGHEPTILKDYTADGMVSIVAAMEEGKDWQADIDATLHNIRAGIATGKAAVHGSLSAVAGGWEFTTTSAGSIEMQLDEDGADDSISAIAVNLPTQYRVTITPDGQPQLRSQHQTKAVYSRSDGLRFSADVLGWSVREQWRKFELTLGRSSLQPYAIEAETGSASGQILPTEPLVLRGSAQLSTISGGDWPSVLNPAVINGDWRWQSAGTSVNGSATWTNGPSAPWTVTHNNGAGNFDLDFQGPAVQLQSALRKYLQQEELRITGGSVKTKVRWQWDESTQRNSFLLEGRELSAEVQGMRINNARLDLTSNDLIGPNFIINTEAPMITLASGIEITNLSTKAIWQSGLQLDHARLEIFDGETTLEPVFLDFSKDRHKLKLALKAIDLDQVLAAIDQPGLHGSGRLSGTLPLVVSDAGLTLDQGNLLNITKGTLRYQFDDGDAGQKIDNIALQALQNFRYQHLDSTLTYEPNGDYRIKIRLEGNNPDLYNGYPIAFNLNLSGSLPGLARASLFTGDFHSELLKQIQQPPLSEKE